MVWRRHVIPYFGRTWKNSSSTPSLLRSSYVVVGGCGRRKVRPYVVTVGDPGLTRLHSTTCRSFSSSVSCRDKVNMTFVEYDGNVIEVQAEIGQSLLEVAHDNDVDLEGACGGDLACSTCHVVLPKEYYDKLGEKTEEEDDMLDLAWGLTDTSRLGCQIKVTPELEGMEIKIPEDSIDMS